jgi:hypothetical protein
VKDLSELRIGIIGMGRLMETVRPCYAELLKTPERLRDQVVATTLDERDLEEKNRRLGFKVQLGDNEGMLRGLKPDLILFAPPPTAALPLAEEVLAPYGRYCIEKGIELPFVFACPPSPVPGEYGKILPEGMDLAVTVPCLGAGGGFVLASILPGKRDEELMELIERFFAPMAETIFLPPAGIPSYLGSACMYPLAGHLCYDISLARGWEDGSVGSAAKGWMEGIARYRKESGIEGTEEEIRKECENYIRQAKEGGWETIEAQDRADCTPGGIAERVLIEYNANVKDAVAGILADTAPEKLRETLFAFGRAEAERISGIAEKKAASLHVKGE